MMKKKNIAWIKVVVIGVLAFCLCYSQLLYSVDKLFADPLYQRGSATDHRIKIIAIDERTIQEMGDIKTWNRDVPARLIELLHEDASCAPALVGFDIMYIGEVEPASDGRFAQACKASGNVITTVNAVIKDKVTLQESGKLSVDEMHVEMVEYPYEALREVTSYGFANTTQDRDGYIRYALWEVQDGENAVPSFARCIAQTYAGMNGTEISMPKLINGNVFGLTFSGKSGGYEVLSLCDVLNGKIDPQAFRDAIVLVGAYAPGMQDSYNVAVQKGSQMYGVEIQANIVEALLEGKTYVPMPLMLYSILAAVTAVLFYLVAGKKKMKLTTIVLFLTIAVNLILGKLLYTKGIMMPVLDIPVILLVCYGYYLIQGYLLEKLRRRKVLNVFKKYVAPQIVEEIAKKGDFQVALGGSNRHIAVLFVDIRGFTPMSESLQPEQVVEILNEYLSLTTAAIFKNGGTLDKFIGDATMAVFNAPFDLDDYIYRAVCTALDIAAGSEALEKNLMERFGKSVSFGIGVNCGPAVVGNIGCDFRMDYTAIGDTVNTAARLESNAKRGQILISADVYEAVKERIHADEVGVIPLKGKKDGALVYEVHSLK